MTEAFSIIIGRIVGSGIFRTPAPVMLAVSGSISLFFGAWVLGGIFTFLSALLYAEMVSMLPKAGGPYVYLKAAYPPIVSFLRGWAMFFVSETASIVVVTIVFADYAVRAVGYLGLGEPSLAGRFLLSLSTIWLLTGMNVVGVRFSGLFQDALSLIKIGSLLAVIFVGSLHAPQTSHFESVAKGVPNAHGWMATILGFAAAFRYVLFAYSGWEGATYVAEEVKDPTRNLPLSLFLGIGTVMVLYLAANVSYVLQLSPQEIQSTRSVAAVALERAAGSAGALLISLAVVANTFGNVNSQIFTKGRTWQAMARDGMFFRYVAVLNPRSHTPDRALMVQAGWATVLMGFAFLAELTKGEGQASAYERIIDFFAFTSALFNLLTFLAVWRLRRQAPDAARPFRTPLFPLVFGAVIFVQAAFAVFTLLEAPLSSFAGLLLTATGLIYWRYGVAPEDRSGSAKFS